MKPGNGEVEVPKGVRAGGWPEAPQVPVTLTQPGLVGGGEGEIL